MERWKDEGGGSVAGGRGAGGSIVGGQGSGFQGNKGEYNQAAVHSFAPFDGLNTQLETLNPKP